MNHLEGETLPSSNGNMHPKFGPQVLAGRTINLSRGL
jgi:hypothetical protein